MTKVSLPAPESDPSAAVDRAGVRARQGYAAALVFDLLRSRGLAADLLSQARLDPQAGLILGQTCLLAPAVLEEALELLGSHQPPPAHD